MVALSIVPANFDGRHQPYGSCKSLRFRDFSILASISVSLPKPRWSGGTRELGPASVNGSLLLEQRAPTSADHRLGIVARREPHLRRRAGVEVVRRACASHPQRS